MKTLQVWLVWLACLAPLAALGDELVVRVETRLVPAATVPVGGTLRLEVDLLVDTWFTAPPQLPELELADAAVTSPRGRADHLSERRDGKNLFGLRFTYLIIPDKARRFDIPALAIQVSPGQAAGPLRVHSQPLGFVAHPLPGTDPQRPPLVARTVTLDQRILRSHDPLRVGDSVTRELRMIAMGAQAARLPAPEAAHIEGLKHYRGAPRLHPVDDGRGDLLGAQRLDSLSYVVERPGRYRLPAIELQWWDQDASQLRRVSAEAVEFEVEAPAAYQAAFDISEDLQRLGRHARWQLARHWLLLAGMLLLGVGLVVFARQRFLAALDTLGRYCKARQAAWHASAAFAWRQVPGQLTRQPARLDALYLWVRRRCGSVTLNGLSGKVSADLAAQLRTFLKSRYGQEPQNGADLSTLRRLLPKLRRETSAQGLRLVVRPGLKPLYPPFPPKRTNQ
ncbi:BatD family protein [Zestomonas carbonaria]|uniref:Oxygen tolerance n=1 Tax=Zestomonas carbonaria TaxID=2762745 RepID=A0A7U7EQP8_9GAMM|nr:BatD family protein [Pseudomonas carbonaria]CAD5109384.1 hypothetical protein PSEWESI4_03681 [Pseudomonas carbonaria]